MLALRGGVVVTALDPPEVRSADVLIDDGVIMAVGEVGEGPPPVDCSGCLVVPGNVCAHTHLYSALARGMPYTLEPPGTFLQILQRVWWRLDRALDERAIRASALVGGAEALLAGTTTLIDHHASPNAIDGSLDVIADALEAVGIRSVLCYEVTDRDGLRRAKAGLAENRRFLGTQRRLAVGMVGAHASFSLGPETLEACSELATTTRSGIHIHVAEDAHDQRDSLSRFATRVVHRLAGAGVLTRNSILAHCIHLDDEETSLVRESGVAVAHNPTSNMNNSVGHASAEQLGVRVALGTDGTGADMIGEAKTAYFRQRDEDVFLGPQWPLARLSEGTRLAANHLALGGLGKIQIGAPADLAVLDYPSPTPIDAGTLAGHWLFGLEAGNVRDVLVAGEVVVRNRRLTRVDQQALLADARKVARKLWERMSEIEAHGFGAV